MERLSPCPSLLSSCVSLWPPTESQTHLQAQPHAWLTWMWNLLAVSSGALWSLVTEKVAQNIMHLAQWQMR